ncbi:MAG TPA: RNA helicase, partial [Herbaspirillum sp.]|nr:RNA helicase [Herbaspirillum sp.]
DMLHDIERFIKRDIPVEIIPGFEPDPKAKPQPVPLRSNGRAQQKPGRAGQSRPPSAGTRQGGSARAQGQGPAARPTSTTHRSGGRSR